MNTLSNIELAKEWERVKEKTSLSEFAKKHGISADTMASRTYRGRKKLKKMGIDPDRDFSKEPDNPSPLDEFDAFVLDRKGETSSQVTLKEVYGKDISENSARKYWAGIVLHLEHKQKLGRKDSRDRNPLEEVEVKADGSRTTTRMLHLSEEDSKDPVRVMELMGYDPLQWELISCKTRRNYWDTTIKNAAKRGEKHTNHAYMCVVSCRPIQHKITTEIVRRTFEDLVPPALENYSYKPGGLLLELPIMDFHLGKLAWADETGEDHYDLDIATSLYKSTILDILGKLSQIDVSVERIVLPVGQDFFHVDDKEGRTTSGTHVDVEGRWQKMYQRGVDLLVWAVEQLRSVAPVECCYVPGNHDDMLSFCATEHLSAWFREVEGVAVDLSPQNRKYVRYGKVLIGFSHGKKEGKRIEHLMQVERPADWGATAFREWHLGDEHHEESEEKGGVIIRRISAITATDAWHAEMGFKGAIRKAQAFLWDKELGKQFTIDSNVVEQYEKI